MNLGEVIYNLLQPVFDGTAIGNNIFPDIATQSTTLPFIIYSQLGVDNLNTKQGGGNPRKYSVQIAVFADDSIKARTFAETVILTLNRYQGSVANVANTEVLNIYYIDEKTEFLNNIDIQSFKIEIDFDVWLKSI